MDVLPSGRPRMSRTQTDNATPSQVPASDLDLVLLHHLPQGRFPLVPQVHAKAWNWKGSGETKLATALVLLRACLCIISTEDIAIAALAVSPQPLQHLSIHTYLPSLHSMLIVLDRSRQLMTSS